jgi:hypothetical protein
MPGADGARKSRSSGRGGATRRAGRNWRWHSDRYSSELRRLHAADRQARGSVRPVWNSGLAIRRRWPHNRDLLTTSPNTSDWRLSDRTTLAPELCELSHKLSNYIQPGKVESSDSRENLADEGAAKEWTGRPGRDQVGWLAGAARLRWASSRNSARWTMRTGESSAARPA